MDGRPRARPARPRARLALGLAVAACLVMAMAAPVLGLGETPAGAATVQAPPCPPECGFVAAGDALLVPYVTVNPGPGWFALPADEVQSYVTSLRHNLSRSGHNGTDVNVAAARWLWANHDYELLIVVVSSPSLDRLNLADPSRNAGDLCAASRGAPRSQLVAIAGIPHSVSGLCAFPSHSQAQGATLVAFDRGNVAVLMQITSKSGSPIDPRTTAIAAQQQYSALPPGGVLVSHGLDIELLIFWLLVVAVLAGCVVASARRRGTWRGPVEAVAEAFRRRRLAFAVTLVGVVGGMAFAMLDASLLHGAGQWYESSFNDFWRNWSDGAFVTFSGGFGHLYLLDRTLETAPAWQVLIAPVARLGFHLPFPDPSVVYYPKAFWLAGPLFLGAMVLPICAGDRWLELLGVTDLGRRLVVLGVMAVTLPPIALFGHSEDLVALGAMLYGLSAALEGRVRATGWWLGVGLAFQFFAFLAVPLALILIKPRRWLTAIVPMAVVPLSFLVVPLTAEPAATIRQLLHQKVYDDLGYISPTWNLDPGVASFVRIAIALAAIPAALVVVRYLPRGHRAMANLVLWTLAALFALRVAEPELVPYFLAPTLALVPISAARRPWWRLLATGALAVWLNWWLHVAVQARWSLWLLLIGQLVVLGWLAWPEGPLVSPSGPPTETVDDRSPAHRDGGLAVARR
ncbi:MAG: hypothetical protein ABSC90_15720 [Acidimicrobiales bacterium]